MPGIDPGVACHKLNIDPRFKPYRQRQRRFAPERNKIISDEIDRLLEVGFIREVWCPTWVSNVVVVRKKNGKWRVCVDYSNLNKACPKDCYPLPKIDQLVNATTGCERLSFLDAYSGYNQIPMAPEDQEKTAFISERGLYCYTVMPFGLTNAGGAYQRLVNRMFKDLLGKTMEVYIDDMVVKSKHRKNHIEHLREAFEILRQYGMRLNPTKCAFGVSSGQFLGHLVSKRGIEPNPEKVEAIVQMRDPETKEDIQVLTGRIAALSRFISRLTDRCKPFFRALKNKQANFWGPEQSEVLAKLKKYLSGRQFLSVPRDGEPLCVYLAKSDVATSTALFREEGYRQEPIAYTSRSLLDAETRYSSSEKVILALVTAKRKLRQYFEGHSITVYTNLPIHAILSKPDTSGRMAKWAIELSEFGITYKPRSALKGQALADFLVEGHFPASIPEISWKDPFWEMHVDGASNFSGAGAGILLQSSEDVQIECAVHLNFPASNNVAEYEALVMGLTLAKKLRIRRLQVYSDSQLVVNLSNDDYAAKDRRTSSYQDLVRDLMRGFEQLSLVKVPREKNSRADELAKAASGCTEVINIVKIEVLEGPSIEGNKPRRQVMAVDSVPNDWRGQIVNYLEFGIQPDDPIEARKLRMKAVRYLVIEDELFKRSFSGPHLRCLGPSQARLVLEEIQEGSCGAHLGGRTLSHKILSQGYYWPYLLREAEQYAKKCKQCQRHAPVSHSPAEELHALSGPWPFARWGMDIVGPLPTAPGGLKYALLATDYHTKWFEADSYATITGETVATFTWRNIICRFGILRYIICDNGTQFNNQKCRAFCNRHGITLRFSSRSYPQGNGQAEITDRTIFDGVKRRLERKRGKWSEELQHVLWAYRTTRRKPTDETPYALTYGMEAVIPTKIILPTVRTLTVEKGDNEEQIARHLDLLDERRDAAAIHLANYQNQVARYFNKGVRPRAFRVGEFVLKRVVEDIKDHGAGKFKPVWEGPYQITEVYSKGAYRLRNIDTGRALPRPWNAIYLKKYYS
ncbi:protein NYNRIN-like [Rosa chinensis]|uniref:protein NYNRIN-like n=1 Tax=Rosa chinensis TaxID=74649 RepID=UPI000D08E312|nr:protein NYNRIN-like [Rosa chinensis]